jgi:hypothetical protein
MATTKSTRTPERAAVAPKTGETEHVRKGEALRPFATQVDHFDLMNSTQTPALAFNPEASFEAVVSMASNRASNLESMLMSWACVSSAENVDPPRLAAALQPLAEEVVLLLGEIMRRVDALALNTAEG